MSLNVCKRIKLCIAKSPHTFTRISQRPKTTTTVRLFQPSRGLLFPLIKWLNTSSKGLYLYNKPMCWKWYQLSLQLRVLERWYLETAVAQKDGYKQNSSKICVAPWPNNKGEGHYTEVNSRSRDKNTVTRLSFKRGIGFTVKVSSQTFFFH